MTILVLENRLREVDVFVFACIMTLRTTHVATAPSPMPEHPVTTLLHAVLDIESKLGTIGDKATLADSVVDDAVSAIRKLPQPRKPLDVFRAIDEALIRRNFIYDDKGKIELLSDALAPRTLTPTELTDLERNGPNQRRSTQMEHNRTGKFYEIDCDTSSVLYLSVAEALNLPIYLIEVPGHNFVKWDDGNSSVDWDTNYGSLMTDKSYEVLSKIPESVVHKNYLVSMRREWVLGYWHQLRGNAFNSRQQYQDARADYEQTVALYTVSDDALNQLAWFLATCPNAEYRNGTKTKTLAEKAVAIWRNPNWLDTEAAALAELHQWDQAVEIEKTAKQAASSSWQSEFSTDSAPDFDRYIDAYRNHKTYVELVHPSAPH